MHLDHFGLRTDPFPLCPSLKFVFMSTAFEEAMAHLAYGLEQEEDIILITGPIGTGKTLALQSLLANLAKRYRTAFVNVTQLNFPELLKMVLAELGVTAPAGSDRADLLALLKDQVRQMRVHGQKLLIVVDEAQNLDVVTLEGLRLLTNLGQPEGQVVQLVLVGQPDLEHRIGRPELAQLRQRIRVHYRLEVLSRKELEAYVAHRLKIAGCERPLFRPKALDLIYGGSSGVPRLVNILASRALLAAYVGGKKDVDADAVDFVDLPLATGVGDAIAASAAVAAPPSPAAASVPGAPAVSPAAVDAAAAARSVAEPHVSSPLPLPAEGALPEPFAPTTVFRRRNQRATALFLGAVLVLIAAAAIVFLGPPHRLQRLSPRSSAAGSDATTGAAAVSPVESTRTVAAPAESMAAAPLFANSAKSPLALPETPALAAADSVEVRADVPSGTVATTAGSPFFAVHVHSFKDAGRIQHDVDALRHAGLPVFYREVVVEGAAWQRVYLGPYATLAAAQEAARQVSQTGLCTYVRVLKLEDEVR